MGKQLGLIIAALVAVLLIYASTFTVAEYEQCIILQFGKVQGNPITSAGLHWKVPFIQNVRYFDKRILQWDGDREQIPTLDKKFIWVDTTARWKIVDSLRFYKAVRDVPNALDRMGTILDGVTKDTISNFNLIEAVRNSNNIFDDIKESKQEAEKKLELDDKDTTLEELATEVERIHMGREQLSELITNRARRELRNFGIFLIDVQLRSVAYKEIVLQKVYNRMISERMKIANKIRSSGRGEQAKILGQLDLSLKRIESEAYRKSQYLKGSAEAKALKILALAVQSDPSYYTFVKTLETYRKTLPAKAKFILSTNSEYLKLFNTGSAG